MVRQGIFVVGLVYVMRMIHAVEVVLDAAVLDLLAAMAVVARHDMLRYTQIFGQVFDYEFNNSFHINPFCQKLSPFPGEFFTQHRLGWLGRRPSGVCLLEISRGD